MNGQLAGSGAGQLGGGVGHQGGARRGVEVCHRVAVEVDQRGSIHRLGTAT